MNGRASLGVRAPGASSQGTTKGTRTLLAYGLVAGPLYMVVGLIQALTREGFDLARHPLSLLSNGSLGWIQIVNFLVSGLLFLASAVGVRRVLRAGRGRSWGPRLIGVFALGMMAAGVFVADPADGFPSGTPPGMPQVLSVSGILHFVVAAVSFLALIAACLVFARRFASLGQRGWAASSAVVGVAFLASWIAVASLPGRAGPALAFAAAVFLALGWTSALAGRLMTAPEDFADPASAEPGRLEPSRRGEAPSARAAG